jgi:DNA-binding NtrC family response regulator
LVSRPCDSRLNRMKILIVDHKESERATLARELATRGYQSTEVGSGQEAIERLDASRWDVVFADSKVPKMGGLALLEQIKSDRRQNTDVVMMSSNGTIQVAVRAMKLGALDFVRKPLIGEALDDVLSEIRARRGEDANPADANPADANPADANPGTPDQGALDVDNTVVGESEAIHRVKRMIKISARTDANVLIYGETGVGKDLVASVIHQQSHRSANPLVKVGCTLLPPALIESELFGHKEGAFTGADQTRQGRFALAEGGTIYLDDVDDIPLAQQAKLLRAIEEKVFERVGGSKLIRADVRIVASTKLNLLDKIAEGTFRQDLYYRLDVLRIVVPPLRERREDIPALVYHLLQRITKRNATRVDQDAMELLIGHDWPGNVRELAHTLERALLIGGGGRVTAELLEAEIGAVPSFGAMPGASPKNDPLNPVWAPGVPALSSATPPSNMGFKAAIEYAERQLLMSALEENGGNKTAAAASLGMKPSTYRDKLTKHGIR